MRLIDAEFVKQRINETMSSDYVYSVRSIKNLIDEAPSINAEPIKYGKWMKDGNTLRCSNCGYAPVSKIFFQGEKIWEISLIDKYHWCPYCGTKMEKQREVEE